MASPAQRALAALPANASVNDKREALNRVYDASVWRHAARTPPYLPWASAEELEAGTWMERERRFEDSLRKDKMAAFAERVDYYQSQGLLKDDVSWMDCPLQGQPAIYILADALPYRMFTIGNTWLHDLPEVLFFTEETPVQTCGCVLNELVDRMKETQQASLERCVRDFWKSLDTASGDNVPRHASPQELEELGMMSWFHRNFLDQELQGSGVWVLHMPCVPAAPWQSASPSEMYEAEGNVCYIKHGLIDVKPSLQLGPTLPAEVINAMAGGLSAADLVRLREELGQEELTAWAFEHGSAVLHGKPLVDHMLKEARRVMAARENGDLDCEPCAGPLELMVVAINNNQPASVAQLGALGVAGEKLRGNGDDRSMLMKAVQLGFEGVVRELVKLEAPLDDTDHEHWTALSIAAHAQVHGSRERAERILDILWDAGARQM